MLLRLGWWWGWSTVDRLKLFREENGEHEVKARLGGEGEEYPRGIPGLLNYVSG